MPPDLVSPGFLSSGLETVQDRMAAAAEEAGRDPDDVTLVAVSKQQPWAAIAPVLTAGQRVFGENRVQEAQARWLADHVDRDALTLHLIGPLQTNKAAEAVALFDVIETVDRLKLIHSLAHAVQKAGRSPRLLIQVNTGEEEQKSGATPGSVEGLIAAARDEGLPVEGLMCIPPVGEPAGLHFALLSKLAARNGLRNLSMGMSGDYETAIRFGATSVRIGSAIFGGRT